MDLSQVDLTQAIFRKAQKSTGNGSDCVEVATNIPGVVVVRDSKNPGGPVLKFHPSEWKAFLHGAAGGEFDI